MRHKRRFARGRKRKGLFLVLSLLMAAAYILRREGFYFPRPQDIANCSGTAGCFTGVVTRVIDGDTLEVNNIRIRLVLVDAPERDTADGSAATNHLRQLCPVGSPALVDQDDRQPEDNYRRMLAVVWCDGKRVNEEIIRAGRAELYHRFCPQSEFGHEPWAVALGCR